MDALKSKFQVPFPVFPDKKAELWESLGKPSTPTLVLATIGGKVLLNHTGLIKDLEGFFKEITDTHKGQ